MWGGEGVEGKLLVEWCNGWPGERSGTIRVVTVSGSWWEAGTDDGIRLISVMWGQADRL